MTKLLVTSLALIGVLGTTPVFADTNGGSTIGRGCTLDPFEHTMRCVDFDHCTKDKNGNLVCPVVVTPRPPKKAMSFAIMG